MIYSRPKTANRIMPPGTKIQISLQTVPDTQKSSYSFLSTNMLH